MRNLIYTASSGTSSNSIVYKSTDGALTWSTTNGPNTVIYPGEYISDPVRPNTLYVGGNYDFNTNRSDAYVSTDSGTTWSMIGNGWPAGVTFTRFRTVYRPTNDSDVLYAGRESGANNNDAGIWVYGLSPANQAPVVNSFSGATINEGDNYSAAGSFTDSDSTSWTATVDYGDGSGTQPLTLSGMTFSLSHTYSSVGTYTVTVTVMDNQGASGQASAAVTVQRQLVELSPAKIWVGLKNSDDVGVKFDLLAEVYKDSLLVGSGQVNSVSGGSSGFNNAVLDTITFASFSPLNFPSGSALKLKLYVRNACSGSGHNSGTARLWFNDSAANSQFDATIGTDDTDYFLRNSFLLAATAGPGPKKTVDVAAGARCSAFKSFGTWTITP